MNLQKYWSDKKHYIPMLALICGFFLLHISNVAGAASIYDTTYIDAKEAEIKKLITDSDNELKAKIEKVEKSIIFEVIELQAGQTVICGASTELIVRTKNAVTTYIPDTAQGGISNLISGTDLWKDTIVPANQLLLVPRDDGRGIKAISRAFVMIKGQYTIK